jgi:PadR family transcriptional regulator PadR
MSSDAPLGTFEEQVMLGVIRAGDDAFGMNVRREIETATGRDVAIGAVYATLDRLEAKNLVRSFRAESDGRSRRMFRITREGARALQESHAMRERLWRGVRMDELLGDGS